jgi:hypothetical protein
MAAGSDLLLEEEISAALIRVSFLRPRQARPGRS